MLHGKPRCGIYGPYRKPSRLAKLFKRLRGVKDKSEITVSERLKMAVAANRIEFDDMYESKRESYYGKRWRPAA